MPGARFAAGSGYTINQATLSAGVVERGELWRWSSLWSRAHGDKVVKALLSPWPVERPANWTVRVNSPLTAKGRN